MKIQDGTEKKHLLPNSARSRALKRAQMRGVPEFALRLMAARLPEGQPKTPVRYRHD